MNRHEFIDWFEDVRHGTRRLIAMVPEEAFDFKPHENSLSIEEIIKAISRLEEKFVKGVCRNEWSDTGGLTDIRKRQLESFAEETDDFDGVIPVDSPFDSIEEILEQLDNTHQDALDILVDLDEDEFLKRMVDVPWGERGTIQRFLVGMVEREIHHRAELYIALQHYGLEMTPMILWGP